MHQRQFEQIPDSGCLITGAEIVQIQCVHQGEHEGNRYRRDQQIPLIVGQLIRPLQMQRECIHESEIEWSDHAVVEIRVILVLDLMDPYEEVDHR